MKGYIRVASAVPSVTVADPQKNVEAIMSLCRRMEADKVHLAVFPELCVTGYTCADLFFNTTLLNATVRQVVRLVEFSREIDMVFVVGLPLYKSGTLYNVAAVIGHGRIWGMVPKTFIPNYNEFYEKRWWASAAPQDFTFSFEDNSFIVSTRQLFSIGDITFGIEICEDLWTPIPPSGKASLKGAEIILNLSASDALIGKYDYVKQLVASQSARCIGAYVYASAGFGESSTDLVFDGITLIAEKGNIIAEGERWHDGSYLVAADIDIPAIRHDRLVTSSFNDSKLSDNEQYNTVHVGPYKETDDIIRHINPTPFVPSSRADVSARCDEIIKIQTSALAQRLKATGTKNVVIGISGGLDSTLALLVAAGTFDRLGLDRKGIHAVTMPGFGTTGRTYRNAVALIKELGAEFREISIADSVNLHFREIGHNPEVHDVTYENSQARMRTMLLMDIANQVGGMVIGTGDMSELALGWATYNGDHMSMYGVNAGVPKTLVRHLVERFADGEARLIRVDNFDNVSKVLRDIASTPISPELIPADADDNITQKTEELVGPYEINDFFLYYTLRYGLGPTHLYLRAKVAFNGRYTDVQLVEALRTFTRRFFSQQFKRSCLPDGPKVGTVCLSPRGDWRMPSDASAAAWLREIDTLAAN